MENLTLTEMAERVYEDFENLVSQGYNYVGGELREMDMKSTRSVESALLEFGPFMEEEMNLEYEDKGDRAEFSYDLTKVDFSQGELVPEHYE